MKNKTKQKYKKVSTNMKQVDTSLFVYKEQPLTSTIYTVPGDSCFSGIGSYNVLN